VIIILFQFLALLAVGVNGIGFEVGGISLNSERILLIPLLFGTVLFLFANRRFYFSRPAWLYLGWIGSVCLSTLLSEGPIRHLNGLLISVAPFAYFLLFMQTPFRQTAFGRSIAILLGLLSVSAVFFFVLWSFTGANAWMIDRGRISLTMLEPNILGATLACLMVLHLTFFQWRFIDVAIQFISILALIFTASKTPYVAYIVAMVFFMFRTGVLFRLRTAVSVLLGGIALLCIGLLYLDSFQEIYTDQFARQDAVNNRMFALNIGWERFLEHPIFGNGPLDFSFQSTLLLTQMGTTNERNLWIWQIWVSVLHDTGLIGFFFFIAFLVSSWIRARRMIRQGQRQFIGCMAAMIVLVICSQATTLHLMSIFGIVMGLMNARFSSEDESVRAALIDNEAPAASGIATGDR
jgi:O-antigen ligase